MAFPVFRTVGLARSCNWLRFPAGLKDGPGDSAVVALVFVLLAWFTASAAATIPQVKLTWDPNPEPDIAGYKVYYGTRSANYTQVMTVGNVTNVAIMNLPDSRLWCFAVTAYNTAGLESDFSNEACLVSVGEVLAVWQDQYFNPADLADTNMEMTVWGDVADPDRDGRNNLVEYALGLNPTLGADSSEAIQVFTQDGHLQFRFKRRKNDPSLVYVPQVSSDRRTWSTGPAFIGVLARTDIDNTFEWIVARDLTPISAGHPRYFRIRVDRITDYYVSPTPSTLVQSYSEVYVGTVSSILGNDGTGQKRTVFSLQSVRPPAYTGTVTSLEGSALTDNLAIWVDDQFNGDKGAFYVEFDSGLRADIIATLGGSQTLALDQDVSLHISPGMRYIIRPHHTLASVFGPRNESGLLPGQNLQEADNILLRDPVTRETLTYFYLSVPGSDGWYDISYQRGDHRVIRPEQGLMVYRKATPPASCAVAGVVAGVTMAPIYPGFNLVGTLKAETGLKLSELGLYTGDAATGVASGQSLEEADTVMVFTPSGTTASYFYLVLGGVPYGWRDVGYQPADDVVVAAGDAIYIYRKLARDSFYWTIPAE